MLFSESVIREMTRMCVTQHGADCLNLAQGFPDFSAPADLKEAAVDAIRADFNQYATTWGAKVMRDAIAKKTQHFRGIEVDTETEITVCCGVTEAMLSTVLALVDPGDEVIIFEPFYENYGPDCILSGATPVAVPLVPPDWHFDPEQLRRTFNARTRAIVINTPHNPTGKVYSRNELEYIASLCQEFDVLAVTDEIYEHLVYRGEHVSLATIDGMRERTRHHQRPLENVQRDRLAPRLYHRPAIHDAGHPEGARLRDRGRAPSPPDRGGDGPGFSGQLLRRPASRLPGAARLHAGDPG